MGYSSAAIAQGGMALAIAAPFSAIFAAIEGNRHRAGAAMISTANRSRRAVVARQLLPNIACGAAVLIVPTALYAGSEAIPLSFTDFFILVGELAQIAAFTCFGFALGTRLSRAFALPIAVVVPWLWIVYPSATEPLWIRHLNGNLIDCCDLSIQPSNSVILAGILVALAVALLSLAFIPGTRTRWLVPAAFGGFLALVLVAVSMVNSFGFTPGSIRAASDLRCAGSNPRICVWKENAGQLNRTAKVASRIGEDLRAAGIATPTLATERPGGDRWQFGISPQANTSEIRGSLASSLIPRTPDCAASSAYDTTDLKPILTWWVLGKANASEARENTPLTRSEMHRYRAVAKSSPRAQSNWANQSINELATCS